MCNVISLWADPAVGSRRASLTEVRNAGRLSTRLSYLLCLHTETRHIAGSTNPFTMVPEEPYSDDQHVVQIQTHSPYNVPVALVEMRGFEPLASAVQRRRSPN